MVNVVLAMTAGAVMATQTAGGRLTMTPPAAQAEPGSELTVYLMTMGPGDAVWERFGHNAVGIRDASTGRDVVYNWGMFSFDQPGFVGRFLRGQMMYWMDSFGARETVQAYAANNREVVIQILNLTPAERLALKNFVEWNERPENTFYAYDYFRDNCSTRSRDAIDRALAGLIRSKTEGIGTQLSYRDQALRLMEEDKATYTGFYVGLGQPSDRKLNAWEEMFIPMAMRDRLRTLSVEHGGVRAPLVLAESTLFRASREPESATPKNLMPYYLAVGVVIAAFLLAMDRAGRLAPASGVTTAKKSRGTAKVATVFALVWTFLIGIIGVALLLLWTVTTHVFAYRNENVMQFHPLWLVAGVAVLLASRPAFAKVARGTLAACALLSVAGLLLQALPGLDQMNGAVLGLAVPINLVTASILIERASRARAVTHGVSSRPVAAVAARSEGA
jgi:hypothetical protein